MRKILTTVVNIIACNNIIQQKIFTSVYEMSTKYKIFLFKNYRRLIFVFLTKIRAKVITKKVINLAKMLFSILIYKKYEGKF